MAEKGTWQVLLCFGLTLVKNWSSFRAGWLLKIGFNLVDTFSIERNVALGIFTLCLLVWRIRRIHLAIRARPAERPSGWWGRMRQNDTNQQDSSAAVELHDHVGCTEIVQPVLA